MIITQRKKFAIKPTAGFGIDWSHPIARGLIGCWLFGEGGGNSIQNLASLTPAIKTGTPTWAQGRFGPAPNFVAGSGSYYAAPFDARYNTGFMTLAAWIRGAPSASTAAIIDRDTETGLNRIFQFRLTTSSTKLHFVPFFSAAPVVTFVGATTINDNKWHHVAAVLDGVNCTLYVDGHIDFTVAETRGVDTTGSVGLRIGAHSDAGATSVFDGIIDTPMMWNRGLSHGEIRQLVIDPFDFMEGYKRIVSAEAAPVVVPPCDSWHPGIEQPYVERLIVTPY